MDKNIKFENTQKNQKETLGINFSDLSIKLSLLIEENGECKLVANSVINFEEGVIKDGLIIDRLRFQKYFALCLNNLSYRPTYPLNAVIALPESMTFVFTNKIAINATDLEVQTLMQNKLKDLTIINSTRFYSFINKKEINNSLYLVFLFIKKPELDLFEHEIALNNIKLLGVEPEAYSARRSTLKNEEFEKRIFFVDIGSLSTSFYIFDETGLCYNTIIPFAGRSFIKTISNTLNKPEIEIEKSIKVPNAPDYSQFLVVQIKRINQEIKNAQFYYEKTTQNKLDKILLLGGAIQFKGLIQLIQNDFPNVKFELAQSLLDSSKEQLLFINSIGSGLKGLFLYSNPDEFVNIEKEEAKDVNRSSVKKSLLSRMKGKIFPSSPKTKNESNKIEKIEIVGDV